MYGSLPEDGAILNQPAGLLRRMRAAENVYNAVSGYHAVPPEKLGEWIKGHPDQYRIVKTTILRNEAD